MMFGFFTTCKTPRQCFRAACQKEQADAVGPIPDIIALAMSNMPALRVFWIIEIDGQPVVLELHCLLQDHETGEPQIALRSNP
jgi:hypothetical protein